MNDFTNNTEFNGIKLSDSSVNGETTSSIKTAIGTMEDESVDMSFYNISAENLGIDNLNIINLDVSLDDVDNAIQMISKVRSKYGSIQK